MVYKKLGEITKIGFCSISSGRVKKQDGFSKWLVCANFQEDNRIIGEVSLSNIVPDSDYLIKPNDIILKRITPTYVNYIDAIGSDIYAGNNLIVISVCNEFYPKYVALILNEKIQEFSELKSVGAVMKSLSRSDLEDFTIPNIEYDKQVVLGNYWYDNIELKKLKVTLSELESKKNNLQILKCINQLEGDK